MCLKIFIVAALLILIENAAAEQAGSKNIKAEFGGVVSNNEFNGSIIVSKNGITLFENYYGMANFELGVPITAITKFRIGSITKQFTSMAILQLERRNKLQLNDELGVHLNGIPKEWKKITIHQLLTHTSGIMNAWSLPEFKEGISVPRTLDEAIALFYKEPLVADPGADFKYSGLGYMILAKVIESVSGSTYSDYLYKELFSRLGLLNTGVDDPSSIIPNRASGYTKIATHRIGNAQDIYMPALTGAGNLYSTPRDLVSWSQALFDHKFISHNAYEKMYAEGVEGSNYGYGWGLGNIDGHDINYHQGVVPGFDSTILRVPGDCLTVVVTSNVRPNNSKKIAETLARIYFERYSSVEQEDNCKKY